MTVKRFVKVLLVLLAVGFAGLAVTGTVLAYTNPELLQVIEKIAEYGLKGLEEYFKFLLDLFKEAINTMA